MAHYVVQPPALPCARTWLLTHHSGPPPLPRIPGGGPGRPPPGGPPPPIMPGGIIPGRIPIMPGMPIPPRPPPPPPPMPIPCGRECPGKFCGSAGFIPNMLFCQAQRDVELVTGEAGGGEGDGGAGAAANLPALVNHRKDLVGGVVGAPCTHASTRVSRMQTATRLLHASAQERRYSPPRPSHSGKSCAPLTPLQPPGTAASTGRAGGLPLRRRESSWVRQVRRCMCDSPNPAARSQPGQRCGISGAFAPPAALEPGSPPNVPIPGACCIKPACAGASLRR